MTALSLGGIDRLEKNADRNLMNITKKFEVLSLVRINPSYEYLTN